MPSSSKLPQTPQIPQTAPRSWAFRGTCALSTDPEIAPLLKARRAAASKVDRGGDCFAWLKLEGIETRLLELDPQGVWRFEGLHPHPKTGKLAWLVVCPGEGA